MQSSYTRLTFVPRDENVFFLFPLISIILLRSSISFSVCWLVFLSVQLLLVICLQFGCIFTHISGMLTQFPLFNFGLHQEFVLVLFVPYSIFLLTLLFCLDILLHIGIQVL